MWQLHQMRPVCVRYSTMQSRWVQVAEKARKSPSADADHDHRLGAEADDLEALLHELRVVGGAGLDLLHRLLGDARWVTKRRTGYRTLTARAPIEVPISHSTKRRRARSTMGTLRAVRVSGNRAEHPGSTARKAPPARVSLTPAPGWVGGFCEHAIRPHPVSRRVAAPAGGCRRNRPLLHSLAPRSRAMSRAATEAGGSTWTRGLPER